MNGRESRTSWVGEVRALVLKHNLAADTVHPPPMHFAVLGIIQQQLGIENPPSQLYCGLLATNTWLYFSLAALTRVSCPRVCKRRATPELLVNGQENPLQTT
jgi:hypothetical protein